MKVKINKNRSEIAIKKDNESKITINIRQKEAFILFTEAISIENPIVITKKDSEVLFNNLCWFMDQHYKIENPDENAKYKDKNHFVWKSDIESFSKDPGTPRLIIDRDKDSISISKRIPLIEETKQRHAGGMVILDQKHEAEDPIVQEMPAFKEEDPAIKEKYITDIISRMLDAGEFHNSGIDIVKKMEDIERVRQYLRTKTMDELNIVYDTYEAPASGFGGK